MIFIHNFSYNLNQPALLHPALALENLSWDWVEYWFRFWIPDVAEISLDLGIIALSKGEAPSEDYSSGIIPGKILDLFLIILVGGSRIDPSGLIRMWFDGKDLKFSGSWKLLLPKERCEKSKECAPDKKMMQIRTMNDFISFRINYKEQCSKLIFINLIWWKANKLIKKKIMKRNGIK